MWEHVNCKTACRHAKELARNPTNLDPAAIARAAACWNKCACCCACRAHYSTYYAVGEYTGDELTANQYAILGDETCWLAIMRQLASVSGKVCNVDFINKILPEGHPRFLTAAFSANNLSLSWGDGNTWTMDGTSNKLWHDPKHGQCHRLILNPWDQRWVSLRTGMTYTGDVPTNNLHPLGKILEFAKVNNQTVVRVLPPADCTCR